MIFNYFSCLNTLKKNIGGQKDPNKSKCILKEKKKRVQGECQIRYYNVKISASVLKFNSHVIHPL